MNLNHYQSKLDLFELRVKLIEWNSLNFMEAPISILKPPRRTFTKKNRNQSDGEFRTSLCDWYDLHWAAQRRHYILGLAPELPWLGSTQIDRPVSCMSA